MVRGLAALAVMLGHLRALFFVSYSRALDRNIVVRIAYLLTSIGHPAVLVFFVLSGFFISRSVLDAFRKARWSWRLFLANRLTRLLLVLLPGLLLCVFWDHLGERLPSGGAFYYRAIPGFGSSVIAADSSFKIFAGNLLFLQSVYFPPFGSDMPLWSLSYEFWYYLLFPMLVIALVVRTRFATRLAYGLAAFAILAMAGRTIATLFLVWLAGAGVGLLHDLRPRPKPGVSSTWSIYAGAALGLAGLCLAKTRSSPGLATDLLVSAAFLPPFYRLVRACGPVVHSAYAWTAKGLASFSYTLYVVHLPLLIFLRTLLGHLPRWQPDWRHAAYGVGLACLVGAYAQVISRFTEARTATVRRMVVGRVWEVGIGTSGSLEASTS